MNFNPLRVMWINVPYNSPRSKINLKEKGTFFIMRAASNPYPFNFQAPFIFVIIRF